MPVTVSHGLDADTVMGWMLIQWGPRWLCWGPDKGRELRHCEGQFAGTWAWAQLLLEAPGQPGLESTYLASWKIMGGFCSATTWSL